MWGVEKHGKQEREGMENEERMEMNTMLNDRSAFCNSESADYGSILNI